PALLAVWLSYLVIVAPNLGLVRISNQIAADRYCYVALMGLVVLAAAGLSLLWQQGRRARPVAAGLATARLGALGGLVVLTWGQCLTWRTSEALWTHALNHGAASTSEVHIFVGLALARQGRLEEATAQFAAALRLNPNASEAYNNTGVVLTEQGKF